LLCVFDSNQPPVRWVRHVARDNSPRRAAGKCLVGEFLPVAVLSGHGPKHVAGLHVAAVGHDAPESGRGRLADRSPGRQLAANRLMEIV
jgi:hypothetical protein